MPLALAAPGVVVAALFAILFLLGYNVFAPILVRAVSIDLPYVGNVIGNLVAEGLDAVYLASLAFLDDLVLPAVNMALGPVAAVENFGFAVRDTLDQMANALTLLVAVKLPASYEDAVQVIVNDTNQVLQLLASDGYQTYADFADAESQLQQLAQGYFTDSVQYTDDRVDALQQSLTSAIVDPAEIESLATTAVRSAIAAAETAIGNQIQLAYGDATAYAQSLVSGIDAEIASSLGTAEQFATTAVAGVAGAIYTDIQQGIAGALGGIYTDVDTAISDLIGVIGTTDADVLAGVKAIPTAIPTDIAGVSVLAGATALTLARYLKDCGIPNCNNLSQYGKDLQGLLGLVEDASFLTFLVELVQHPADAPTVVADTFGSALTSTVGAFRSLVGV